MFAQRNRHVVLFSYFAKHPPLTPCLSYVVPCKTLTAFEEWCCKITIIIIIINKALCAHRNELVIEPLGDERNAIGWHDAPDGRHGGDDEEVYQLDITHLFNLKKQRQTLQGTIFQLVQCKPNKRFDVCEQSFLPCLFFTHLNHCQDLIEG